MNRSEATVGSHRRTRLDHATETAEDYAEAIFQLDQEQGKCRVIDLARRFDVSHVTVIKIIARLKREKFVTSEPYGPLKLTESGKRLAKKSRREHENVLQFLLAIGVSSKVAAADAEGIEHHVSEETLRCFQRMTALLRADGNNNLRPRAA